MAEQSDAKTHPSLGASRTVTDCGCGTGGILSITKDHVLQLNPQAKVMRWQSDLPLRRNATFTWVRHFIDSLAPHDTSALIVATL